MLNITGKTQEEWQIIKGVCSETNGGKCEGNVCEQCVDGLKSTLLTNLNTDHISSLLVLLLSCNGKPYCNISDGEKLNDLVSNLFEGKTQEDIQHIYSELHIFCRLKDWGIKRQLATVLLGAINPGLKALLYDIPEYRVKKALETALQYSKYNDFHTAIGNLKTSIKFLLGDEKIEETSLGNFVQDIQLMIDMLESNWKKYLFLQVDNFIASGNIRRALIELINAQKNHFKNDYFIEQKITDCIDLL